jgi:hypothetical protein
MPKTNLPEHLIVVKDPVDPLQDKQYVKKTNNKSTRGSKSDVINKHEDFKKEEPSEDEENSISSFVTKDLFKRLKRKEVPISKHIIIIDRDNKEEASKKLVKLTGTQTDEADDKDDWVVYGHNLTHLPMYNKSVETILANTNIAYVQSFEALVEILSGDKK